jgi:hypothetical protein
MADEPAKPEAPPPPPPPAALLPALATFERGDWASATAQAGALLSDPDPEVQAAARALMARMAPDPWAIRVGLLSLALLVIVAVSYVPGR